MFTSLSVDFDTPALIVKILNCFERGFKRVWKIEKEFLLIFVSYSTSQKRLFRKKILLLIIKRDTAFLKKVSRISQCSVLVAVFFLCRWGIYHHAASTCRFFCIFLSITT